MVWNKHCQQNKRNSKPVRTRGSTNRHTYWGLYDKPPTSRNTRQHTQTLTNKTVIRPHTHTHTHLHTTSGRGKHNDVPLSCCFLTHTNMHRIQMRCRTPQRPTTIRTHTQVLFNGHDQWVAFSLKIRNRTFLWPNPNRGWDLWGRPVRHMEVLLAAGSLSVCHAPWITLRHRQPHCAAPRRRACTPEAPRRVQGGPGGSLQGMGRPPESHQPEPLRTHACSCLGWGFTSFYGPPPLGFA